MVSHDAAGPRCDVLHAASAAPIWFIEGNHYVTIPPFDTPQHLFLRLT
jgi:hypothetical protein